MNSGLWIVGAFLSGSIPFGYLIAKAKGVDIRATGSGNIGATNVGRALGKRWAVVVFVLDFLKGLIPVLAAGFWLGCITGNLLPELVWVWAAVALAAVLGHVFTPWLGFRGGKGIATGSGAVLALFPIMTIAGVIGAVVWFVSSRLTRMVSAASIIAAASLPLGVVIAHQISVSIGDGRGPITPFVALGFVLAFLVVYTHRANIGRIRRGQEPRIGSGKASVGPSGGVDLPR